MRDVDIAKSPRQLEDILDNIKRHIQENLTDIDSIRVVGRCCNCYKKTSDYTIVFSDEKLSVRSWSYNCNTERESHYTMEINDFDHNELLIWTDRTNSDTGFCLKMDYGSSGLNTTFNLSPYYSPNDYVIHGERAYADRNIKMIQRETEDGLVLMLQNFIDFKGLRPMFSDTIYIEFKHQ